MAFLPPPRDWSLGDIATVSVVGSIVWVAVVVVFDAGAGRRARDYGRVSVWAATNCGIFAIGVKVTQEWGWLAGAALVGLIVLIYWFGTVYRELNRHLQ